ncbi:hypothetical protein ACOME3_000710 [Neoechinorhynchus agilis]
MWTNLVGGVCVLASAEAILMEVVKQLKRREELIFREGEDEVVFQGVQRDGCDLNMECDVIDDDALNFDFTEVEIELVPYKQRIMKTIKQEAPDIEHDQNIMEGKKTMRSSKRKHDNTDIYRKHYPKPKLAKSEIRSEKPDQPKRRSGRLKGKDSKE